MDEIGAQSGGMKPMPVQGRSVSACGRDCATCPKKLTCPLSPFMVSKSQGGRA